MVDVVTGVWRRARGSRPRDFAEDLAELRAMMVRLFAGATAAMGFALLLYLGLVTGRADVSLLLLAALLVTTAGVAIAILSHHEIGSAVILVAGLTAAEGVAQRLYPATPIADSAGLVGLAALSLLGGPGGLLATGVVSVVTVGLARSSAQLLSALALTWASFGVAWLGTRPLHTVISWAMHGSEVARLRTAEAQTGQAELARVSRNLRIALAQLKRTNEELERARVAAADARQRKVEFATTVSHELRTPLNLIIGFSEMMVLRPRSYGGERLPETYRGDVEAIYRNACHLSDLIDDVLDLSQVDARRMALQPRPLAIGDVIHEAISAVSALFADKGVRIVVGCPPGLPSIVADRTRIRQVIINLLANAARFTDRGTVTISAQAADAGVDVSVRDTGVGMEPDELTAIFTEFHRAGSRLEPHTSGLGLAICKRLVELHGGRIWAESSPGSGTTFSFRLPPTVPEPGGSASWDTWATVDHDGARRVLAVVSDDQDALRLFRRYLDRFRPRHVGSVGDAFALARRREADAVLVVESSGRHRAGDRRSPRHPPAGLPILHCSVRTLQQLGRRWGASAYLTKPVTSARLQAALQSVGGAIRCVLVVDDDPEMIRLLTRMLLADLPDCEIMRADGGRAALRLLEKQRPDVVLLDLLMPDVDGYEVLRQLRASSMWHDMPVVIVSARGSDSDLVVADGLTISRPGGLPFGELTRCLQASLEVLTEEPLLDSHPVPRGATPA